MEYNGETEENECEMRRKGKLVNNNKTTTVNIDDSTNRWLLSNYLSESYKNDVHDDNEILIEILEYIDVTNNKQNWESSRKPHTFK